MNGVHTKTTHQYPRQKCAVEEWRACANELCLLRTVTADFRAPIDWSMSFSSALNSASSFWRRAVALSSASWFFAISAYH